MSNNNTATLQSYLSLFIVLLIWAGLVEMCDSITGKGKKEKVDTEFKRALDIDTEEEYKKFFEDVDYKYKNKLDSILWNKAILSSDYLNYVKILGKIKPFSDKVREAKKIVDEEMWRKSVISNDFENYIVKSKDLDGRDGEYTTLAKAYIVKRNDSINFLTDSSGWRYALKIDSSRVYQKYIDLFPQGKNIQEANQLVVDKKIDEIFKNKYGYGALPSMEKTSGGSGTNARIGIYNNTPHTLTLCYSGPTKKIVYIESQKTTDVILTNGEYKIGASVDKYGVRNFAGSESINGGNYEVQYYIVTTRN